MSNVTPRFRIGATSQSQFPAGSFLRHCAGWPHPRSAPHVRVLTVPEEQQRVLTLKGSCDLLADGFDDLDQFITCYVREVPPHPTGNAGEDVERFLQWLAGRDEVSEEQRDFIVCQRARQAVEFVALRRRLAHVRFQMLLADPHHKELSGRIADNHRIAVHLNPVHVWATLETHALLAEDESLPATVLFFPVGDEVRSAVVDWEVQVIVQALAHGARTVKQLAYRTDLDEEVLVDLLAEMAEMGLVALGMIA